MAGRSGAGPNHRFLSPRADGRAGVADRKPVFMHCCSLNHRPALPRHGITTDPSALGENTRFLGTISGLNLWQHNSLCFNRDSFFPF